MPREFGPAGNQYAGTHPEKNKPSIAGHEMPPGKHKILGHHGGKTQFTKAHQRLNEPTGATSGPRTEGGASFASNSRVGGNTTRSGTTAMGGEKTPGGARAGPAGLFKQFATAAALRRKSYSTKAGTERGLAATPSGNMGNSVNGVPPTFRNPGGY